MFSGITQGCTLIIFLFRPVDVSFGYIYIVPLLVYQEIFQLYIMESGILENTLKSNMLGSFLFNISLGRLIPI